MRAWIGSPPPGSVAPRGGKAVAAPSHRVAVGSPVGYPREAVNACLSRLRIAHAHAVAAAIVRTEPFASAARIGAVTRGGRTYYYAIEPWDRTLGERDFTRRPDELGPYAIQVARHYATAIVEPSARPRNMNPSDVDRAFESIPTHDRTAAWEAAWARWALDAIQAALNTPSYNSVAPAVLSLCGSLGTTTVLP